MEIDLFWRGMLLGFSIAAPVGPIGLLVIRRTLAEGRLTGLITGLGAAVADGLYGLIGALGLTLVTTLLTEQTRWLQLVGGLFLIYLGITTFRTMPAEQAAPVTAATRWRAFATTFALTLTNPMTIMAFAVAFAGLGLAFDGSYGTTLALVGGVLTGSTLWWLLLSSGVSLVREHISRTGLRWINRLSGVLIGAFGVVALLAVLAG